MPQEILPCVTYPTTIIFVDDDEKYLNYMAMMFGSDYPFKLFDKPQDALKFLKENYKFDPFTNRCAVEPFDIIPGRHIVDFNIRLIRNEAFNPSRSKEIGVIILDFAMADMTGGELAEQLKGTPFKIILLTGEASAQTAVKLFNEGVIHSYIRKDDSHFKERLCQTIKNLQQQYFQDISRPVFDDFKYPWPKDPVFKGLIDKVHSENNLVESFLLDEYGGHLFLDLKGNVSFLAVSNENLMKAYQDYMVDYEMPVKIRTGVESKTIAPFFFNEEDYDISPLGWGPYMHPVQVLEGLDTYYYSYIVKPDPKIYKIDGKIISYGEFLRLQG